MSDPVYLVGLNEFVRDLRAVDRQFPRMVSQAMRKAAKVAERRARARYSARYRSGGSDRSTRTVKGISAFASARQAGIQFGGPKRPWLVGQEFGSNKYPQFRAWTGRGPGNKGSWGRAVYPAMREVVAEATRDLADDLTNILKVGTGK